MTDGVRVPFFEYPPKRAEDVALPPGRTALVVIDVQQNQAARGVGLLKALDILTPGSADYIASRLDELAVPAIAELQALWRTNGWPIVHVCYGSEHADLRDFPPRMQRAIKEMERLSGVEDIFWTENPQFSFREEVSPLSGETVLRKTTFSAFNSTDIEGLLHAWGVKTVVLAGITTNCCVETTGRDASERGLGVVVVDEATADFDPMTQEEVARTFSYNFGAVVPSVASLRQCVSHGSTDWINATNQPSGSGAV